MNSPGGQFKTRDESYERENIFTKDVEHRFPSMSPA